MRRLLLLGLLLIIGITTTIYQFDSTGNGNELYITSSQNAQSEQGIVLTDQQLITLFVVNSNYDQLFNGNLVVEHNIDFNTQGTYNIKFIASYQEILCFDDKDDADGSGTGKNQTGSTNEVGIYCQNNADDGEVGDNDRYKYIDKQKVQTAKLKITAPKQQLQISSLNYQSDYEHTEYSDDQLIELFEVEVLGNENNQPVEVVHNIDFNTPGQYEVTFTVSGVSKTVEYEVIDLKPTLDNATEYTIKVGDSIDYLEAYNVNAAEFEDYDLNQYVNIHDRDVDYNQVGDYQVTLSVSDQEGNVIIKTVTLHIVPQDTLNAKPLVIRKLGTTYTDQQLKQLFELTANYELDLELITIEHNINFNTVGEYQVTFTDSQKNISVTTKYQVVSDIERNLQIEKICVPIGNVLTKQDYIDAYTHQIGEIKDQAIIESLQIDDSYVDYTTVGTYQVNIKATNSAGESLNRVFALCITEGQQIETPPNNNQPPADVCIGINSFGKPISLLSRKVSTVSLPPSDSLSDANLRQLFGQPQEAAVISDVIPDVVGDYSVRFEREDCSYVGTVQIKELKVIESPKQLEQYLTDNNLNNMDPDQVPEGDYTVTIVDTPTDEEVVQPISYQLTNTGTSPLVTYLMLIVAGLIIIGIGLRVRLKS